MLLVLHVFVCREGTHCRLMNGHSWPLFHVSEWHLWHFVSRETLGYSHIEKNTVRRHSVYTHRQQASPDGSQTLGPLLSWEITFLTLSTVLGCL